MSLPVIESRACLRCGNILPKGSGQSRKYCAECGRRRNIELTLARQQAAARKREEKRASDQAFADREYCKTCKYYGSGEYHNNLCDYFLMTGKRRGCRAGVGCERRVLHGMES